MGGCLSSPSERQPNNKSYEIAKAEKCVVNSCVVNSSIDETIVNETTSSSPPPQSVDHPLPTPKRKRSAGRTLREALQIQQIERKFPSLPCYTLIRPTTRESKPQVLFMREEIQMSRRTPKTCTFFALFFQYSSDSAFITKSQLSRLLLNSLDTFKLDYFIAYRKAHLEEPMEDVKARFRDHHYRFTSW